MLKLSDVVHDTLVGSPVKTPRGLVPPGMHPAGWQETRVGDVVLVCHGSVAAEVAPLLEHEGSLHDWASRAPGAEAMQGRLVAWAATLPESGLPVVVRHSAHGGLLSPITSDRFVQPRAGDELRLSWSLRQVGVHTPRVLAYALHPALGRLLWRADVMTQRVPHARDLAAVLRDEDRGPLFDAVVAATEHLLGRMRTSLAHHPDLNVKNILIAPDDAGTPLAWVLDVDTVRFAERDAGSLNRARLVRSARKWARTDGRPGFARFADAIAQGGTR
jgi:3-deoxy-D-manno-octulosonic acid kinase